MRIPQVRQGRGSLQDPDHQNTLTEQCARSCLRLLSVLGTTALPRSTAHQSRHFLPSRLCCHHQPRPLRAGGRQQCPEAWLLSPETLAQAQRDGQVAQPRGGTGQGRTPPCCQHQLGDTTAAELSSLRTPSKHTQPERQTRGNSRHRAAALLGQGVSPTPGKAVVPHPMFYLNGYAETKQIKFP